MLSTFIANCLSIDLDERAGGLDKNQQKRSSSVLYTVLTSNSVPALLSLLTRIQPQHHLDAARPLQLVFATMMTNSQS